MENLQEILFEITSEWRSGELGLERVILAEDIPLDKDLVLAIQGVRRSGKSTLLRQIAHKKRHP